jgi:hypothetical protein
MGGEVFAGLLESVEDGREKRVDSRDGSSQPRFGEGSHE